MSRSNPADATRNPSTRWFEWAGGSDGGFLRWYNKETKESVKVPLPFTFLLLDELSTVKGWHDASDSGIYANEVKDMRQEVLVVRCFDGGEIASGLYSNIKDRVKASGGHYCASLYIAYKDGEELKLGNLMLKGAAAGAWMSFKKENKGVYTDAVVIREAKQEKKGATVYKVPVFSLKKTTEETNTRATALDKELQKFLADYLKRPKAEAAQPVAEEEVEPKPKDPARHFDDMTDDIPF